MPQYNSYYLYQKMIKYDGQDWIPSYPAAYSEDGVDTMPLVKKMDNDPECGYEPVVTPIYRWVDVTYNPSDSSTYMCDECPHDYLTFRALEDGTFTFSPYVVSGVQYSSYIQYSLDSGSTWSTAVSSATTPTIQSGSTVMWKGIKPSLSGETCRFSSTGRFEVEGNVMSLVYGDNFSGQTDLTEYENVFENLFYNCSGLTSAENLILPATVLGYQCYYSMFLNCTSLTTAPQLPATTLAEWCYYGMFQGCTSLTTAPVLSATTLANWCYESMFEGCTSLTTAPILPATTLAVGCYWGMFFECTSLTTVPSNMLPATTLEIACYTEMFINCTSLTTAPVLSATTLEEQCYEFMFSGCTNLSSITCMATDISANSCTNNWVYNVASAGTFIRDCNTNWSTGSSGIPNNWQDNCSTPFSAQYLTFVAEESGTFGFKPLDSMNTVQYSTDNGTTWATLSAESTSSTAYTPTISAGTKVLLKGTMTSNYGCCRFSSSGHFHVEGNIMSLYYGDNFENQTSLSGKVGAFMSIFVDCGSNLTSAENLILPATTLEEYCYYNMFSGCTSITTAPVLSASTMVSYCYAQMFKGCTSLTNITCLAYSMSGSNCTKNWVSDVSSSGTFYKHPNATWLSGNSGTPDNWTVQDYS